MIGAYGDGKIIAIFADADAGKYLQFTYVTADRQWTGNQRRRIRRQQVSNINN